jgi:hypothetical protein
MWLNLMVSVQPETLRHQHPQSVLNMPKYLRRMSDRDPVYHGRYSPPRAYNMGHQLNPAVTNFALNGAQQNNTASQVSAPASPYLEARILNLEEGLGDLRGDIEALKELYHDVSFDFDKLRKDGWPVTVGPFRQVNVQRSQEDAVLFSQKLETLKNNVHVSTNGRTDVQKANGMALSKTNGIVPPHLRASSVTSGGTVTKSLPPHLRKKDAALANGNG